jgi:hydroxypyruvate isomerase
MIFRHLPFVERLNRVDAVGATAFEFWSWGNKNLDEIEVGKRELGLSVTTFNLGPGVKSLTRSNLEEEFKSSVKKSIQVAKRLDCRRLIGPVGLGRPTQGLSRQRQLENAIENLKAVVPLLEGSQMTLLIEPVNPVDHTDYFLRRSSEAAELISKLGSSNVKILYDFYHQQITEGNLIGNAKRYSELIGFYHVGDVPGRHEPGTGEINYRNIFRFLDKSGYDGYVGLEFVPSGDPDLAIRETFELAR